MAEEQPRETNDVLAEAIIRLGFTIKTDGLTKELNPVLQALERQLNQVGKASKIETGIFGKDFLEDKLKSFTGLDNSLFKAITNMQSLGTASKLTGADQKEFYNSLNFVGKALADVSGLFRRKSDAEKEAAKQSRETQSIMADLDDQLVNAEGFDRMLGESDILSTNLQALGPDAAAAANSVQAVTSATEGATSAMRIFQSVATLGLALLVTAAIAASKAMYQMFMQAVTARDEVKKFDQLFGGVGQAGVIGYTKKLQTLNREVWDLGYSLEKVNGVAFEFVSQGINFGRAMETGLVKGVLELSGAAGIASGEISSLYGELLKTTNMQVGSVQEIGNSFIAMNKALEKTGTLGPVAFSALKESITSSANALGIAANKGEAFTNKMTKDLTALAALTTQLSASVGELNGKFEEAGSLLTSQDSGFRTLLALSNGANIDQMLTNQFDKTDAMIKGIKYLQDFNRSFGGNIQLTAQVASQQLGISKEMAIKMINMRKESIDDMLKAQQDIQGLQTGATREAFENVNSGLASAWGRVKTMFTTFFQNAFGGSSGMQNLVARVEGLVGKLRNYMTNAGWIKKLEIIIDKVSDWIGNKLTKLLDWVGEKLDQFAANGSENPLVGLWNTILENLIAAGNRLGEEIGRGFMRVAISYTPLGIAYNTGKKLWDMLTGSSDSDSSTSSIINNPILNQQANNNRNELSNVASESNALSKYKPDTVTYGKDAYGNVGFMTVAQKQYALELKKEELEKEKLALQKRMTIGVETLVEKAGGTKSNNASRPSSGPPEALSPLASGEQIRAATYGRA